MCTKKCNSCGNEKELTEFHKDNGRYRSDCKICFRLKEKERRLQRILKKDPAHAQRILDYRNEREMRGEKKDGFNWCYSCNQYKINEDFSKSSLKNSGKCRKCSTEYDLQKGRELKLKAIEYKGGKCKRCNFIGHYSSLVFHHTNPNEKEFDWYKGRKQKWEILKLELDKCDLLCANCHNLIHSKLNNDGTPNIEYVEIDKNRKND